MMEAEFMIVRQFKQPLEKVWQAWSLSEQIGRWWGPKGCKLDVHRFEFQPGGFFHYAMNFDGAPSMWGRFNYREIKPQESIVWLNSFSNERCGITRAPFSDVCPLEIQNTVIFSEEGGITTVTLRAVPFGEVDAERNYFIDLKPSMEQGYGGTFDQLADWLK
ncbi:SRPBCC domain-containing protein [Duganella sp. CT11-25]|jgi:uncharacterized protein YndB with AHSA1/START domain|uniref:SRPBCC family protein n=1 Tax=unclassified Duganella TaxID=2636909 RepID=UPI0039AF6449